MSDDLRKQMLERFLHAQRILEPDAPDLRGKPTQPPPPLQLPEWKDYFACNETVELPARSFRFNTYYTVPSRAAVAAARTVPVFVFHHGAGSSALTFAPLARELSARLDGVCGVFAFDARGHGDSRPLPPCETVDYALDAFVGDFHALLDRFLASQLASLPREKISLLLVGHSLGGSICSSLFARLAPPTRERVVGLAMFDIVEEAAVLALDKVDTFLASTPNSFRSMPEAVDWHVQHGLSKTRSSAAIAIPALFRQASSGEVVRKTDLQIFRPFWNTWFTGLSQRFVSLSTSKLLVLAGNDNLDRQLIIGQMQGKFQLVVFQMSGHFIQEDYPAKTALTLIDFWRRNDSKTVVIKTNWKKHDA
ncbi:LAFE_0A03796g1_1 [Lachancea fermentati]|uniref:Protein phosphatase methylesterase 1 n=1 Tax=Lachancea fermentati TaxID=4955 RepID=A0A1G4M6K5_LACFM|nr:LAFE_0A03796g1_1 [Lachancea fermentati]